MIFAEILLDIGFHILSLMNSTYPSTIWDKSSASYAHMLAKNSVSAHTHTQELLREEPSCNLDATISMKENQHLNLERYLNGIQYIMMISSRMVNVQ